MTLEDELIRVLTKGQRDKLKTYDQLDPRVRADFTHRIVDKIESFLDSVAVMNHILDIVPFKSSQRAFKPEHIDMVFDLMESMLVALDYAPIVKDQDGNPHRFKGIPVTPKGGGVAGSYQKILPASSEEIARNEHLQNRLKRLEIFTKARVTTADYRPPSYFEGLVEDAEKEGLDPFFVGFIGNKEIGPKPPLEDRIREAWELHGIEPPPGYEHVKKTRNKSGSEE